MRLRLTLTAGLLTGALACTAPAALAGASDPRPDLPADTAQRAGATTPEWAREGGEPGQTSDDVPGRVAQGPPSFLRGGPVTSRMRRTDVVPGVTLTQWDQHDARGPLRFQLLVVKTRRRGLSLDYGSPGQVPRTAPVTSILKRHGAVAGVNGDFFDIGDTGAPLGLGRERGRAVRHAQTGWNNAFFLTRKGRPDIGVLPMRGRVRTDQRDLEITNVNSPSVRTDGIGVYTRNWGRSPGYRVTDGQKRQVRVVQVHKGVVQGKGRKLREGKRIRGSLLIGRGAGARQLRKLQIGDRARLSWWLQGGPRMAISGNLFLVRDGITKPIDDREMHPRTAVGVDHDTGEVLLLAVDGRQSFSRGQTMVELARTMVELGADEALNLDGGGSTTMAVHHKGRFRVVNAPSDGHQRSVPNALEVHYRKR